MKSVLTRLVAALSVGLALAVVSAPVVDARTADFATAGATITAAVPSITASGHIARPKIVRTLPRVAVAAPTFSWQPRLCSISAIVNGTC